MYNNLPLWAIVAIALAAGFLSVPFWRWLMWWWLRHRQPATPGPARFAVFHTVGHVRRCYHTSNDPQTAKAHYHANNAPRGTVIEFYDRGKFRGRRVQT
jgi:hypothetical protein